MWGVPVKLGAGGVEEVVEVELTAGEQSAFACFGGCGAGVGGGYGGILNWVPACAGMTGILVGEGLGCGFVHTLRASLRWLVAPIAYGTSNRGEGKRWRKGYCVHPAAFGGVKGRGRKRVRCLLADSDGAGFGGGVVLGG